MLPIVKNPWFEKYRARLGEELFQEFAESTISRAKEKYSADPEWIPGNEKFWMYRLGFFTDEEVKLFLNKRSLI